MSDLDPHFERKLASVRTLAELDGFEKGLVAERTRRGQRVAVTEQRDIDAKRAAIAAAYGVSEATVWGIKHNRTWKDV